MLEAKDLEALTGGPFYCRCGNHEYTFKPLVQKDNFFPVDLKGLMVCPRCRQVYFLPEMPR